MMKFNFETAALTHVGNVRKVNEDSLFADARRGIWVVADGMGGHRDGGVASAMITDAARALINTERLSTQLSKQLAKINQTLADLAGGEDHNIIGSTVAALLAEGANFTCVWAGDSRCYLVRKGVINQISRDHTEVQELVASGIITLEEARTWPRRNVITRAVGAARTLELDQVTGVVAAGDCFVLCSDGLTGHVTDAEILSSVTWSAPQPACEQLLALALERGGKDNISIIVVNVRNPDKTFVIQTDRT